MIESTHSGIKSQPTNNQPVYVYLSPFYAPIGMYTGWPKISKPLPNYQLIILNCIRACQVPIKFDFSSN